VQGFAASAGPTAPSQGVEQAGGQPETDPALGTGNLHRNGHRTRPDRDISPMARQGCGELGTSTTVASLRQALMAPD